VPAARKITSEDYPELLAAVDAGVTQRALARRYDCAPSLIARHVARAREARDFTDITREADVAAAADELTGSLREILEGRLRDPKTSARDLASLANALARLKDQKQDAPYSPLTHLRFGTFILEPGPRSGSKRQFRLMGRVRGGISHLSGTDYDLTAAEALYLLLCMLSRDLGLTLEALGVTQEDIAAAAKRIQ
jgi:hypothetical protein